MDDFDQRKCIGVAADIYANPGFIAKLKEGLDCLGKHDSETFMNDSNYELRAPDSTQPVGRPSAETNDAHPHDDRQPSRQAGLGWSDGILVPGRYFAVDALLEVHHVDSRAHQKNQLNDKSAAVIEFG